MDDKSFPKEKYVVLPSNYLVVADEANRDLADLYFRLCTHWKLFVVSLVLIAAIGIVMVANISKPGAMFRVSTVIGAPITLPNGGAIPLTFHTSFLSRINLELVPALISEMVKSNPDRSVPGVNVSWSNDTGLIKLVSRAVAEEVDISKELHLRLADKVVEDLSNSYQVFNFGLRNELLSIRSQIIDLKQSIGDDTALDDRLKVLEARALNYENALLFLTPRVFEKARVSDYPAGLPRSIAYATVIVSAIFLALLVVLITITIDRSKQRGAQGD